MIEIVPQVIVDGFCPLDFNMIGFVDFECRNDSVICKKCWEYAIEQNEKLVKGYKFVLEREERGS